jgi:hypothetical protein
MGWVRKGKGKGEECCDMIPLVEIFGWVLFTVIRWWDGMGEDRSLFVGLLVCSWTRLRTCMHIPSLTYARDGRRTYTIKCFFCFICL